MAQKVSAAQIIQQLNFVNKTLHVGLSIVPEGVSSAAERLPLLQALLFQSELCLNLYLRFIFENNQGLARADLQGEFSVDVSVSLDALDPALVNSIKPRLMTGETVLGYLGWLAKADVSGLPLSDKEREIQSLLQSSSSWLSQYCGLLLSTNFTKKEWVDIASQLAGQANDNKSFVDATQLIASSSDTTSQDENVVGFKSLFQQAHWTTISLKEFEAINVEFQSMVKRHQENDVEY